MGESRNQPFQLSFNWLLRVAFQGSRAACDSGPPPEDSAPQGGLILVRELDERLVVSELIEEHLLDSCVSQTSEVVCQVCWVIQVRASWVVSRGAPP